MNALSHLSLWADAAQALYVGSGRIRGGWGYVWSAYGIAWGGISLYALSLWLRRRNAAGKGNP
jgi:hypothetical protein